MTQDRVTEAASATDEPTFAGPGEYPTPETEHGKALSSRLRSHGLDFDRSIYNIEQEAARPAVPEALDDCPGCRVFHDLGHPDRVPDVASATDEWEIGGKGFGVPNTRMTARPAVPALDVVAAQAAFERARKTSIYGMHQQPFWETFAREYAALSGKRP